MRDTDYDYKVCYRKHDKSKLKIFIVTNAYELAAFHIRWYETHSPPNENLLNVTWVIVPIETYTEYKRLWRNIPF